MDRRNAVAAALHVRLMGLADWLYGCGHRQTTFPITLRARMRMEGEQSAPSDTYIVCLECGRHFAYDWTTMHIAKRIAWAAPPALPRVVGAASRGLR